MVEEFKISSSKINPKSARTKNWLIISLKVVNSESLTTELYKIFFLQIYCFNSILILKYFLIPSRFVLFFRLILFSRLMLWPVTCALECITQSRRGGWCGKDVVLTGKDSRGFPLKEGKLCSSFAYQQSSAGETLLILIITQINGKVIRKLHNGSHCACVSCLLVSHGCCVPCAWCRSGVGSEGSSVPAAEQELNWF